MVHTVFSQNRKISTLTALTPNCDASLLSINDSVSLYVVVSITNR